MFTLCITNRSTPLHINVSFFRIATDCRWIYAISNNEPLLLNFRNKLESFTPAEYLQYLNIEVVHYNQLSDYDIENNNLNEVNYRQDRFYVEGIINHTLNLSFDEFLPEHWDFFNEIEDDSQYITRRYPRD